jgi:tetratricopeptide (TPR) repeat protein
MIDKRRAGVLCLLSPFLLLAACVVSRTDDSTGYSKGDKYLHYGAEAYAAGQPAVAESRFNWALGLFKKTGNLDGQIRAHINLAEHAFQSQDLSLANTHIGQAEDLVIKTGAVQYRRRIQLMKSSVALKQGDYEQARIVLTGLLGNGDEQANSDKQDEIHLAALINRASLARQQGNEELAYWIEQIDQAAGKNRNNNPSLNAQILRLKAELHRRRGEFSEADAAFEKALLAYQPGLFDREIGTTLTEWAQLDMQQSRWFRASDKLRRSVLLQDKAGDREGVIAGLQMLVKVEAACGRPDEADALRELMLVLQDSRGSSDPRVSEVIGNK